MVKSKAKRFVPARARPPAKALYWRTLPRARKRERFARSFRRQGALCLSLGSPLYAELLERAGRDIEERGPCWAVLEAARPTTVGADDALPLRFMAGIHRLVLAGDAPSLARHFPSAGGTVGDDPWSAFSEAVSTNIDALRDALRRPVQTNEVRRCAALVFELPVRARRLFATTSSDHSTPTAMRARLASTSPR